MKLWEKGTKKDIEVEKYTVGNDYLLDQKLVQYDVIGSIAHAKMLGKIGVITKKEMEKLIAGLNEIKELSLKGKFVINREDEDCHTAIENYLTKKYGEAGKKIHTGRSRNDQVLTALRLYEKEELKEIKELTYSLQKELLKQIKKNKDVKIPGYTHTRKAMPTTIGMWLDSYNKLLTDDIFLIESTLELIDKNPLGSGAGYGVPVFNIDKEYTTEEMGFGCSIDNPIHAQMTRGKYEVAVIGALQQIMLDLNRLSTDMIMQSMDEFGIVKLPAEFSTGSSIMPQKKNPDVLELIRGNYHVVIGEGVKVSGICSNLITGYHRDMQLTKEPVMKTIELTKQSLNIMAKLIEKIELDKKKCSEGMTEELYATEVAYKLVKKGIPFRDAYKKVGKKYSK